MHNHAPVTIIVMARTWKPSVSDLRRSMHHHTIGYLFWYLFPLSYPSCKCDHYLVFLFSLYTALAILQFGRENGWSSGTGVTWWCVSTYVAVQLVSLFVNALVVYLYAEFQKQTSDDKGGCKIWAWDACLCRFLKHLLAAAIPITSGSRQTVTRSLAPWLM